MLVYNLSFFFTMRIGLLSDTHGHLDKTVMHYFRDCEEVWHAGDIGTVEVAQQLENFKPLRAVHGNIDGQDIRLQYPQEQRFICAGVEVWIIHIGGKPPYYTPTVRAELQQQTPGILVCGHSHILRVIRDPLRPAMLYLNPGAAGRHGMHQVRTLLRFEILDGQVKNMEAIELGKRAWN